jgi:hypothetical protein
MPNSFWNHVSHHATQLISRNSAYVLAGCLVVAAYHPYSHRTPTLSGRAPASVSVAKRFNEVRQRNEQLVQQLSAIEAQRQMQYERLNQEALRVRNVASGGAKGFQPPGGISSAYWPSENRLVEPKPTFAAQ